MAERHPRQHDVVDVVAAAAQQPRVLETRNPLTDCKLTHRSPRICTMHEIRGVTPGTLKAEPGIQTDGWPCFWIPGSAFAPPGNDAGGHAFITGLPIWVSLWSGATSQGLTGSRRSILIDGPVAGGGGEGTIAPHAHAARPMGGSRGEQTHPPTADTFPKLLIRNARVFGDRPAMRHKDLGIWQTWTWAQVLDEVRAYAVGLHRLGLAARRHHRHRRRQPAEALLVGDGGAGRSAPSRCRSMPMRSPTSLPMCWRMPRCASPRSRTRSRSTRFSRCRTGCRSSKRWSTTSAGACAITTTPACTPIDEVIADGRTALAEIATVGDLARRRDRARARAPTPRSFSTPPAPPASRRAWCCRRSAASRAGCDTVAFDKLTEHDEALAYLPLAWVGDHYLNYAQGLVAGFCMACPESADTAMAGSARDRADVLLRAAAHLRADADARHDPHGGRGLPQAPAVPLLSSAWRGATARRSSTASRCRCTAGCSTALGNAPGLRAAQERARPLARARRLYRGRGDRARPVLVLPLARPEPEAALRPDRSLPLSHRAAGRPDLSPTRSVRRCRTSTSASPTTARCCSSRPACSSATSRTRPRPRRR